MSELIFQPLDETARRGDLDVWSGEIESGFLVGTVRKARFGGKGLVYYVWTFSIGQLHGAELNHDAAQRLIAELWSDFLGMARLGDVKPGPGTTVQITDPGDPDEELIQPSSTVNLAKIRRRRQRGTLRQRLKDRRHG